VTASPDRCLLSADADVIARAALVDSVANDSQANPMPPLPFADLHAPRVDEFFISRSLDLR
jgi:hypothetical protein